MASIRTKNRRVALMLGVFVAGMVGMAYASVPLYRLFCQITGYGGTPRIGVAESSRPASDHKMEVRFDANTNKRLPWRFKPVQKTLTVKLGESNLAFYEARNDSDETITGSAVFNVTPYKVATYFTKIDCFCFTEQTLKPGETVRMPVEFLVDPEIFSDPNTKEVRAITLSYTFYPAKSKTAGRAGEGTSEIKG